MKTDMAIEQIWIVIDNLEQKILLTYILKSERKLSYNGKKEHAIDNIIVYEIKQTLRTNHMKSYPFIK